MMLDRIVQALEGKREGSQWRCQCPVHGGAHLSVGSKNGSLLVHCKAGAKQHEIIQKLKDMGLWGDTPAIYAKPTERLVAEHPYIQDGKTLAIKGRFAPKTFRWRLPDAQTWSGLAGLKESELPLYRAHEIKDAPIVFVCEGEKAVDACWQNELAAVCPAGGASQKLFGQALQTLIGRQVVLWPDNDELGFALMRRVSDSLDGLTQVMTISPEVPAKGDAFDYFAAGGTVAHVYELVSRPASSRHQDQGGNALVERLESGSELRLSARRIRRERTGIHATIAIEVAGHKLAWGLINVERDEERVRLANSAVKKLTERDKGCLPSDHLKIKLDAFCDGLWTEQQPRGEMLPGAWTPLKQIARGLVLEGGGTIIYGAPGRGKSWAGLLLAVSIDEGLDSLFAVHQANILYVNLERSRPSMQRRLAGVNTALGLPHERPLAFYNARGHSLMDVVDGVASAIADHKTEVLILDSISRVGAGDLTQNAPVNQIIDTLNGLCGTWVALAHTPREDETHVFGSVMFEAGEDVGVQLLSESTEQGQKLGIGLQVRKANDLPQTGRMKVMALEFGPGGLGIVRPARSGEFPEIEAGREGGKMDMAINYLLRVGEATAGDVADEIGLHRTTTTRLLGASRQIGRKREGRKVIFYVCAQGADSQP